MAGMCRDLRAAAEMMGEILMPGFRIMARGCGGRGWD